MQPNNLSPESITFLQQQKDRQEIWDCLIRYTRGLDRFDYDLMASAYHADAWDDHGMKSAPGHEFCAWAIDLHSKIQSKHHHILSNHAVELDGDTAHTETYFQFWGENIEGPPTIAFGRYIDRFEKRGGRWAIAYRRCITEKVGSFMESDLPEHIESVRGTTGPSRRDKQDTSYLRPLRRQTP